MEMELRVTVIPGGDPHNQRETPVQHCSASSETPEALTLGSHGAVNSVKKNSMVK